MGIRKPTKDNIKTLIVSIAVLSAITVTICVLGMFILINWEYTLIAFLIIHPLSTLFVTIKMSMNNGFLYRMFPIISGVLNLFFRSLFWDVGRGWFTFIERLSGFYYDPVFILPLATGFLGIFITFIYKHKKRS